MSEQNDDSQKTEDPTEKKLQDSKRKGEVAVSREVNSWFMFAAASLLALMAAPALFVALSRSLRPFIAMPHQFATDPAALGQLLHALVISLTEALALPILVLLIAAFAGGFVQNGFIFAIERLKPTPSKISLIKGMQRLFSARSLMEFAKGILKIVVVGAVALMVLLPAMGSLEHFAGLPMPLFMAELHGLGGVLAVTTVIAALDIIYQRHEHYKQMRMTKQEVKDEFKQTEGDPQVKARLRQLRQEKARKRMMQEVPRADVVITNPTHYAVAMTYEPAAQEAPVVVAKGVDEVARRIREVAREHEVPVVENPPLARALHASVEIDEEISPGHYQAVAEIITYVFRQKNRALPGTEPG